MDASRYVNAICAACSQGCREPAKSSSKLEANKIDPVQRSTGSKLRTSRENAVGNDMP
jgi:hypothetical protein